MSRRNPRFRRTNPVPALWVGNIWQLSLIGQLENQLCINNLYYGDDNSVLGPTPETSLANAWQAAALAAYLGATSNEYSINTIRVSCLTLPSRIPIYYAPTGSLVGTGGVGHLPTTTAGIMSKYTSLKGQSGRGRIYIPAVPLPFVTSPNESTLNATGVAAYTTLRTALIGTVTGAGRVYTPVVPTRRGIAPGAPITLATAVNNLVIRTLLGNVRRRRIGRGK